MQNLLSLFIVRVLQHPYTADATGARLGACELSRSFRDAIRCHNAQQVDYGVFCEVDGPDFTIGINIPAADKEKLEKAQTRLSQLRSEIWREFRTNPTVTEDENARNTVYGLYQAINWEINHGGSASDSRLQSLLYGAGRDRDLLALERTLAVA